MDTNRYILMLIFWLAACSTAAVADSGHLTAFSEWQYGVFIGSGFGHGHWTQKEDEKTGDWRMDFTETSPITNDFDANTAEITSEIAIQYEAANGFYSGDVTHTACTGECDDVVLNERIPLVDISASLQPGRGELHISYLFETPIRETPKKPQLLRKTLWLENHGTLLLGNPQGDLTLLDSATGKPLDNQEILLEGEQIPLDTIHDDDRRLLYTLVSERPHLRVISTASNQQVADVDIGHGPAGMALSPDRRRLYVTLSDDDSVAVIDTQTHSLINLIAVGHAPSGIALNPEGTLAYVANNGDDSVSQIDVKSGKELRRFAVGNEPTEVIATQFWVYVVCRDLLQIIYTEEGSNGGLQVPGIEKAVRIDENPKLGQYVDTFYMTAGNRLYHNVFGWNLSQPLEFDGPIIDMAVSRDQSLIFLAIDHEGATQIATVSILQPDTYEVLTTLPGTSTVLALAPYPRVGKLRIRNDAWTNVHYQCEESGFLMQYAEHTCSATEAALQADVWGNIGNFYARYDCPVLLLHVRGVTWDVWTDAECLNEEQMQTLPWSPN